MQFDLIDRVIERSEDRIVALKQVTSAEEYLADHFPGFPVLPGVMMVETLVQAARKLLPDDAVPYVLGQVRGVRYGRFVRPGQGLRVDVSVHKRHEDGSVEFKGEGSVVDAGEGGQDEVAVSGRLTLRPARVSGPVRSE